MNVVKRFRVLGADVDAVTIPQLNSVIAGAIERGECKIIANHNLHSVYLYHKDGKMRDFYSHADCVHVDGMSLIYLARLLGHAFTAETRVAYLDWMGPMMAEAAQNGWRVFYLGCKPGTAERGAAILRSQYLGLHITTAHGYFDARPGSEGCAKVLAAINSYKPHILIVGMGMPRQEKWIVDHLSELSVNAILNAGGYLDYVAGEVPTPPRWVGRLCLEWLFRLCAEPRRLWHRYLVEPWFLLGLLLRDKLRRQQKS